MSGRSVVGIKMNTPDGLLRACRRLLANATDGGSILVVDWADLEALRQEIEKIEETRTELDE